MEKAEPPPVVTARLMRSDEVEEVFLLVDPEGWNLCLNKLTLLHKYMPSITYVLVNEKDKIVATFALTETHPGEYVLGNIVVRKYMRGKGLGRRIINEFCRLIPFKVLLLNSVPEATNFYTNVGMVPFELPRDHVISHMTVNMNLLESKLSEFKAEIETINVFLFEKSRLDELKKYDSSARGYDSSNHTHILTEFATVLLAEDKSTKNLVGYAAPFLHRNEIVFDGIIADSDAVALALFSESIKQFPGVTSAKLQTLKTVPLLVDLGEITETYEYIGFAEGKPTRVPEQKIYCVTDGDYTV